MKVIDAKTIAYKYKDFEIKVVNGKHIEVYANDKIIASDTKRFTTYAILTGDLPNGERVLVGIWGNSASEQVVYAGEFEDVAIKRVARTSSNSKFTGKYLGKIISYYFGDLAILAVNDVIIAEAMDGVFNVHSEIDGVYEDTRVLALGGLNLFKASNVNNVYIGKESNFKQLA